MEREFVPYDLYIEIKKLGFDEKCLSHSVSTKDASGRTWTSVLSAPLYQQAFRFFREKYKIRFFIQSGMSDLGEFFKVIFPDGESRSLSYATYELAEIECLNTLIEIVKAK